MSLRNLVAIINKIFLKEIFKEKCIVGFFILNLLLSPIHFYGFIMASAGEGKFTLHYPYIMIGLPFLGVFSMVSLARIFDHYMFKYNNIIQTSFFGFLVSAIISSAIASVIIIIIDNFFQFKHSPLGTFLIFLVFPFAYFIICYLLGKILQVIVENLLFKKFPNPFY